MRSYRHQITFLKPPEYQDGQLDTGEPDEEYEDYATVRASVEPYIGMHDVHEKQSVFQGLFRICVRYRTGLSPQFRIRFDNRTFNIIHMETKNEIHRFIEITAREIQ